MKTINKSKGFTLIELMVVIAIISLLSSVVLASIKTAREKAQITKTVAEMKSLQTALELYKNKFGVYPGGDNYPDVYTDDTEDILLFYEKTLESVFQNTLITNKFISKIPHAPNYPNNCVLSDCTALGYSKIDFITDDQAMFLTCGRNKIKEYVIFLIISNNKTLNLPVMEVLEDGNYSNFTNWWYLTGSNAYCLSM